MSSPMKSPAIAAVLLALVALASACSSSASDPYASQQRRTDLRYAMGMGNFEKLDAAASAFLEGTNECIHDVRDRGIRYERSLHCAALQSLSMAYIAAGGDDFKGNEPSPIKLKGQEALKYAWMARAISELGGGMQNVWIW